MSNRETPQNGATPKRINFAESPAVPDWVQVLLDKEDPSLHIYTKLSDEGFCEALTHMLALAPTPAQLDEGYAFLKLFFLYYEIGDLALLDEVHQGRWNYFTGGRS